MWDEFQTAAEQAARDRARRVVLNAIGYEGQEPSIQQPPHYDEQAQYLLFYGIVTFIAWCIRSCFAIVFLIAISIGTYASLWKAIMHGLDVQSHPIYFDYSPLSTGGPMIPKGVADLRSIRRAPWIHSCDVESSSHDHYSSQQVEYACINSVNEEKTYRVGGGDEMGNKIGIEKVVLEPGRRYFFELSLTLPESDINKQLGIFMVNVALRSVDRSLLALSKQHSLLPFESLLVSLVRKTIYILPLASGILSETKTITLNAFDKYSDANIKKPVSLVEVSIDVPNSEAFPATMRSIQIQSAELRYGKEMNPIQAIIRKWHYLCAIIGISVIFLSYVWILLKFLRRRAAKHRAETHPYGSLFGSDDDTDDGLASNDDRWSGVDIEILDDDENDSGVWEPIDANGRKTTNENDDEQKNSAPNDHVVSDDDHDDDDESVSMKQNKPPPSMDEGEWDAFLNFVGKERGEESTAPPLVKQGESATVMDEPLFPEKSSHDNKEKRVHSKFDVENGASSRIKEELKMADMLMRGYSKLDTCSDRDDQY
jgi:hypothetical protein